GGSGRTYYGEGRGYDREGQSRMSGYGEERGGRSYQDYAGGGSNDFYGSGGYESNDRGQYQYQRENSGQPQGQFYGGGRYYGGGRDHEWGSNPRSGYGHEGRNWWDKTTDKVQAMFGDDDARRRSQWDSQTGQHRGRGPKGYQRSDERIREDVHDRLTDDHHLDASNIEVMVKDCEITLNGTVSSREDKRRAEDLVESCSGVKHVQNNLRVDPQAGMSQSSGMGGSSMSQASGQKTQGGAGIESNPKLAKAAASRA
ncbi:MAG: BON domain-containing protein, partial [Caulobacteraceae bacterium]